MEGTPNSRNLRIINNFLAINFVRTENVKLKYTTFVFESNGVLLGGHSIVRHSHRKEEHRYHISLLGNYSLIRGSIIWSL